MIFFVLHPSLAHSSVPSHTNHTRWLRLITIFTKWHVKITILNSWCTIFNEQSSLCFNLVYRCHLQLEFWGFSVNLSIYILSKVKTLQLCILFVRNFRIQCLCYLFFINTCNHISNCQDFFFIDFSELHRLCMPLHT